MNLKKNSLLLASMAIAQLGLAGEPGKLHISGNMVGPCDSVKVMVVDLAARNYSYQNTFAVNNGKFDFAIPMENVSPVYIMNVGKQNQRVVLYGVPGEDCQLRGKWQDEYFVGGSNFYQQYDKMDQALTPTQRALTSFVTECQKMMDNGVSQDSVMKYYQTKAPVLQEHHLNAQIDFIKNNPQNEAVATLFSDIPVDKVHDLYNGLDNSLKNGRMKPLLDQAIASADRELARQEQAKNIAPGKPAPTFTLKDIKGNDLSLESLRGKYVVLDFWGSWCGWCIKGFPEMKKYYEQYKSKMEILGIDCNDTEAKWKDAVEKHQLPWLHVYNPRNSDIATKYAIEGYPTKIVVDPQGIIARVVIGEDPEFYTYLDSLFK